MRRRRRCAIEHIERRRQVSKQNNKSQHIFEQMHISTVEHVKQQKEQASKTTKIETKTATSYSNNEQCVSKANKRKQKQPKHQ